MALNETELMFKVAQQRDSQAFAALYDLCAPTAFNLACQILKNRSEAEDVVQQAFLSLWEHASQFDARKARVSTWLHVFVRNRCIDLIRKRKHATLSTDAHDENDSPFEFSDGTKPLDEQLTLKTQQEKIQQALQLLPEEQRTVIKIAYYEGLSQQEISERLNFPLGTIKTRMRLGMLKLTQILKNELELSQ